MSRLYGLFALAIILLLTLVTIQDYEVKRLSNRVEALAGVVQGLERDVSRLDKDVKESPGGNQP